MDKGIYCELAEWIDNEYICRCTGNPCTITPVPNKYECVEYSRRKTNTYKSNTLQGE